MAGTGRAFDAVDQEQDADAGHDRRDERQEHAAEEGGQEVARTDPRIPATRRHEHADDVRQRALVHDEFAGVPGGAR